MSYSVFLQNFSDRKTPFGAVQAILNKYGTIGRGPSGGFEFTPTEDEVCEVAFLGDNSEHIDGISFSRPASGPKLRSIIFELLGLPGMCYYELDVREVLARSDVSAHLPPELLQLCESGTVTVITSETEIDL